MGCVRRVRKILPGLVLLFVFSHCSDVKGVKERYLAEKMFHKASKLYQSIQMAPTSADSSVYRQARESFRHILVKYPLVSLQTGDRFSEKALQELKAITGSSQMNIADLFFQEGQVDSAIVEYRKVTADYADNRALSSRAQYSIAMSYQKLERWDEAISAYEVLLKDYTPFVETPDQPDETILQVPVYIAQVCKLQGNKAEADRYFQKARRYLSEVVRKWPNTVSARFAQNQIAVTYLNQERWREAVAALEPLVVAHTDSTDPPQASFAIAELYLEKLQEWDKAMEIYLSMTEEYPHSKQLSRAYLGMAKIHLQRGELATSREEFNRVIADFPEDAAVGAHAQYSLALTYEMEGEWDKALNEFQWAMENYPNSPEALLVPSHILDHHLQFSGRELASSAYSQAVKDYARLIARDPDSPRAALVQSLIAQCHMKMENWEEAIAALETLVESYPQSPQASLSLLRIGEIYEIHLEQPAKALQAYQRLAEESPGDQLSRIAGQRWEKLRQELE